MDSLIIFTNIISILLGGALGYFIRGIIEDIRIRSEYPNEYKHFSNLSVTLPNFVLGILVVSLFISIIAEIVVPTYKTNPLLYGAVGTLAGLLFARGTKK